MRRSGAVGIPTGDLFLYTLLISVSLAFCCPVLFQKNLISLPPLRGALTYGYLTLPTVLAWLLEGRRWLPDWIREWAGLFGLTFTPLAIIAFLIVLRKLFALITLSM